MHYCPASVVDWADPKSVRLDRADPPALAHRKSALLYQTWSRDGAVLLLRALAVMRRFAHPLTLDPTNCLFATEDGPEGPEGPNGPEGPEGPECSSVRVVEKYSARAEGPRFLLKHTFVPVCPGRAPPDWVHPSLLEPDSPLEAGVVVAGRVFPYEELHRYCTRGEVDAIRYQAEDRACDSPRVHVVLSRFEAAEESMFTHLVHAHLDNRLTVDACHVDAGARWYRFTSQLHTRSEFSALRLTPRLFTLSGRGGLRGAYEHLLRKHVLFYERMARGVSSLAFNQLGASDVGEMWDKHGARDVGAVRAVAGAKPPLFWAQLSFDQRKKAKTALARMPWASSVMKPPILTKRSWRRQHARANASKSTFAGLDTPQIRNCLSREDMRSETEHLRRYPYSRKPVLITDAEEPVSNPEDYEGVVYLRSECTNGAREAAARVVHVGRDSCDARHAAYLVQWFPLLFQQSQEDAAALFGVDARAAIRAAECSAQCADRAREADVRVEEEDQDRAERRKAMSDVKKYEELAAEFEALALFHKLSDR